MTVIERLAQAVHHDWGHSHAMDLTDEGLLAEFEAHKTKDIEELALQSKHDKHKVA